MSKILVTGGTGLVGSALNMGIKISSKDVDLRDSNQVFEFFNKIKPEYVIHCAGRVGGVGSNMNSKGEFFYDNIMINTNVIEAARRVKVKKLLCCLSTCVFPDKVEYPITEEQMHRGEPHSSNYPYAYAKRMADIQIKAYREQYETNYISIIPTNIYGPNDNFNTSTGHVLPSLIHKCYLAKKNNTDFEVWGSGTPLREFVYSKDIAKICSLLLERYDSSNPIIITSSKEYSIKQVVNIIAKIMNFKGNIKFLSDKPDGQYRKPADNSKLLSIIPEFEFTSLEDGLQETIDWFITNYKKIRK